MKMMTVMVIKPTGYDKKNGDESPFFLSKIGAIGLTGIDSDFSKKRRCYPSSREKYIMGRKGSGVRQDNNILVYLVFSSFYEIFFVILQM